MNLIILASLMTLLRVSFVLIYGIIADENVSLDMTSAANYILILGIFIYILITVIFETKESIYKFFNELQEIKENQRYILRTMCLCGFVVMCLGYVTTGALFYIIPSGAAMINEVVKKNRRNKEKMMSKIGREE